MSLETAHRRHHTEPTPHPDEPQPIKWTGRRSGFWTEERAQFDYIYQDEDPTGKRVAQ